MSVESAVSRLHAWCVEKSLGWPDNADNKFERYIELLLWGQEKTNLTGFDSPDALVDSLMLDSLQILRSGQITGPLLDVGTGAGFPAIPIKILLPDLKMSLVEPRTKRYAFLRKVERELKIENISIYKSRIENVYFSEIPGIVISKAFAPLNEWLSMCLKWAKDGASVACLVSLEDWQNSELKDYRVAYELIENHRVYAILKHYVSNTPV